MSRCEECSATIVQLGMLLANHRTRVASGGDELESLRSLFDAVRRLYEMKADDVAAEQWRRWVLLDVALERIEGTLDAGLDWVARARKKIAAKVSSS